MTARVFRSQDASSKEAYRTEGASTKLASVLMLALTLALAVLLLRRTEGIYTRRLAIVILLASAGLFYVLDPSLFGFLVETGLRGRRNRGIRVYGLQAANTAPSAAYSTSW